MSSNQWGADTPNNQPYAPGYGAGHTASKPEKDPFSTADITGSLIVGLGIIGIIVGLIITSDDTGAGIAAVAGSIGFAALGLLLSAVARIGSGLWKAGHIK